MKKTMQKQTIKFNGATFIVDEGYEVKYESNGFSIVKKDDTIYVPDCINISKDGNIIFNEGKQLLYVNVMKRIYCVCSNDNNDTIKHKLVPCKREDLKCGDTAFKTDVEMKSEFYDLSNYCKILNENEHVYIFFESNIAVSDFYCNYWYKVVKV